MSLLEFGNTNQSKNKKQTLIKRHACDCKLPNKNRTTYNVA